MAYELRDFLDKPWLAQLLRRELIQQRWLVDQLIPEMGRFLIAAPWKTGKSLLAFQLTHCVALGVPFLGYEVFGPRRVHYIDFESGPIFMQDRLNVMASVFPGADENIFITMFPRSDVLSVMRSVGDVGLFIIDPAISLRYEDENSAPQIRKKLDEIASVARDEFGAAVTIVHHSRKPSREPAEYQGLNEARGSGAFIDWVDGGLAMREVEKDTQYRLQFVVRGAPTPDPLMVVRDAQTLTYSRKSDILELRKLVDRVVWEWRLEHGNDGRPSQREIIRRLQPILGKSYEPIYRLVKQSGIEI